MKREEGTEIDIKREQSEGERKVFFRLVQRIFHLYKDVTIAESSQIVHCKLYDPHTYLDMYADSGPLLEIMPLPTKGCKIQTYALCWMGSSSRHTCYGTGLRFARPQPNDLLTRLVAIYDEPGLFRTYTNRIFMEDR